MKKNKVRLTEAQLHQVIKESVGKVLTEGFEDGEELDDTIGWISLELKKITPLLIHLGDLVYKSKTLKPRERENIANACKAYDKFISLFKRVLGEPDLPSFGDN